LLIYNLNVKQFGSQMKPHICCSKPSLVSQAAFIENRAPDKKPIYISSIPISPTKPMFNHLLESSQQ